MSSCSLRNDREDQTFCKSLSKLLENTAYFYINLIDYLRIHFCTLFALIGEINLSFDYLTDLCFLCILHVFLFFMTNNKVILTRLNSAIPANKFAHM